ncbi:hypothetical protein A2707_05380 [Candidatus Saccharibacteria bacterium RIFCSPHIGHO2_01_FULL_45_15]|nr:MAG: hypothetical protein A2707_05380 [Candidatus Saccharibacteria bacterium RIFCSPHIGHO2_01_FULL_45_15]OGL32609.1 MAG: hypothetical protein A3E76_04585 [Candidatus Saccharibacteria bacterium RIFCSPHIGHO2_12_FULL_44_22]
MFRKLVSNLSFSPALITQVSFYAHRLRQEEVTRRMTVVFVVLALVMQSLAVFSPPDSANAASEQDLIRGGVQDLDDLLVRYDNNTDDIKDIYTTLGVDRSEIAAAKSGSFNSKNNIYNISRYGQYSAEQGETSFSYKRSTGGVGVRFISPLHLSDTSSSKKRNGTTYEAWVGNSSQIGWFAIMKSSASLATKGYPTTITPDSTSATSAVVRSLKSVNTSQSVDATSAVAKPFDKISNTLTLHNTGTKTAQLPLSINLSDMLEYSTLIDDGGGTFNTTTKTLAWDPITVAAGVSQERTFAIQLASTIPATPVGQSNGNSYDCIMSTTYGSNIQIPVNCPVVKGIENIIGDLPGTGILINVIFSLVVTTAAVFFYARTRQMKKEIKLIRHNLNSGTI